MPFPGMRIWRKLLSAGLLLILLGCAQSASESERELATQTLAEFVAKNTSPRTVLVISNPFTREPGRSPEIYAFEKAGIAGLAAGFGKSVTMEVDYPALKPEVQRDPTSVRVDPRSTTPLSFLVSDGGFSEVTKRHPKADLIVSLIGLPVNLAAYKEWSHPGLPKFALLLPDWRMIGGKEAIIQAFRSGKLVVAVAKRSVSDDAQGGMNGDFASNFHLVTAENVEALLKDHPEIFGLR
ncbi:MAG: hypothetical protein ACXW3Z_16640 [Limisphaerales bacterium]